MTDFEDLNWNNYYYYQKVDLFYFDFDIEYFKKIVDLLDFDKKADFYYLNFH